MVDQDTWEACTPTGEEIAEAADSNRTTVDGDPCVFPATWQVEGAQAMQAAPRACCQMGCSLL